MRTELTSTSTANESRFATLITSAAGKMSERVSRRSFVGRIGVAAVASTVGVPALALLEPGVAAAHGGYSKYCSDIWGGRCDTTYGCYCGCWNTTGGCSICDCCDNGSGWCSSHGCTGHSNPDNTQHSCCFGKEYSSPAGCGSISGGTLIICRDLIC
jgi:hypothetical protein